MSAHRPRHVRRSLVSVLFDALGTLALFAASAGTSIAIVVAIAEGAR